MSTPISAITTRAATSAMPGTVISWASWQSKRAGHELDAGVDRRDVRIDLVNVIEVHPQQHGVVVAEPAPQRERELVDPWTASGSARGPRAPRGRVRRR
jgi:hypothetical protein